MTRLMWDQTGERKYEYGINYGVLYIPNGGGIYDIGYAWNGLTTVTESPTGAEANPQYADNIKYLNLLSLEQFGATVEAFTYPDEFGQCDGTISPEPGVNVGQQTRHPFGLSYQTRVGNDLEGTDFGFKIHLVWNALATPSQKAYATINDSPEGMVFSWDITTTPVDVGTGYKPTAIITIDSTKVDPDALIVLMDLLYGTVGVDPVLPTPAEVLAIFAGTLVEATPTAPAFNSGTHTITIPSITGVKYTVGGVTKPAGALVITVDTIVTAYPLPGYKFPAVVDNDWFFDFV